MKTRVWKILTTTMLLSLAMFGLAQAATITVTNTADSGAGTLRYAITNTTSGDTINFDASLSGQTITLTNGQLTLSNNMTIDASSLPGGIIISGNNASRVFSVASGSTVVLNSLQVRDGSVSGNGGGVLNNGNLTLNRCTLSGNHASTGGGAIAGPAGSLTLNECTLAGNSVSVSGSGGGGAISFGNLGGTLAVSQSTLSGNSAPVAGGIYQGGGSLAVSNCIVAGNTQSSGDDTASASGTATFSGVNLTNGTPQLAPLGNYGGPTLTMLPLPGSPAIDGCTNGTSFTTDQRGYPRVSGAYADIGAVELQFATATTLPANPVGPTSATLNGSVLPGDLDTTTWFEWGATTNYGNFTVTNILAATTNTLAVSNNLSGLVAGSTYHFRVAASNSVAVSYGSDQSFVTPTFTNVPIAGLPALTYGSVACGDYNNDGHLDFLITGVDSSDNAQSQLWRNNGDGTFSNVTATAFTNGVLPGVWNGSVTWGDYNNNGRLDLLITGEGKNGINASQLWRNNGNGTFSNVTATAFPAGLPQVEDSSVAWGDYNNDGRLDLLITGSPNSPLKNGTFSDTHG